ncbi:MAG: 5'-deoxynucleotidase [Clostridiales bacterium]|jgi:5'-deoxynucleotidase|nr:5'-deoxynucleotidase [Oscillospiraceae bacterium]PWL92251.1 MAG: 5'-deoxynucleotidase [Clostridiales bacterium]
MDCHFYALMARMRYIQRWALMRNTEPENVQEHSHMVAVLAHALVLIQNRYYGGTLDPGQAVLLALYHDATEILTGDLPTPIKYYNPDLRSAYQTVEDAAARQLLDLLPTELREDYVPLLAGTDPELAAVVKAADKLDAYLKCVKELKAGNTEFRKAREQTYAALMQNPLPALQHFLLHFLPSFELTLDELNGSTM